MHQRMPSGSQSAIDFQPFADATSAAIPHRTTGASEIAARTGRPKQSQFAAKSAITPSPIISAPNPPAIITPHEKRRSVG